MTNTMHETLNRPSHGERESCAELVRVIGGARDGHFAPARSIHIYPLGTDPNDVYVLRRLKIGGETVKALVLSTIPDPVAVSIFRSHSANDAEAVSR
jgi:hypothetical protein